MPATELLSTTWILFCAEESINISCRSCSVTGKLIDLQLFWCAIWGQIINTVCVLIGGITRAATWLTARYVLLWSWGCQSNLQTCLIYCYKFMMRITLAESEHSGLRQLYILKACLNDKSEFGIQIKFHFLSLCFVECQTEHRLWFWQCNQKGWQLEKTRTCKQHIFCLTTFWSRLKDLKSGCSVQEYNLEFLAWSWLVKLKIQQNENFSLHLSNATHLFWIKNLSNTGKSFPKGKTWCRIWKLWLLYTALVSGLSQKSENFSLWMLISQKVKVLLTIVLGSTLPFTPHYFPFPKKQPLFMLCIHHMRMPLLHVKFTGLCPTRDIECSVVKHLLGDLRWVCMIWELLEKESQVSVSQIKSPAGRVLQKYVYTFFMVKMRINLRSFGLFWINFCWDSAFKRI